MQPYQEQIWLYADRRQLHFSRNNTSAPKTMAAPHWHEGYEVLYIRNGWGEQQINAHTMRFHPGEIVAICPGDIHATAALSPTGCEIDVVQFTEELLGAVDDPQTLLPSGIIRPEGEGFGMLFDAICRHTQDGQPGQELMMAGFAQLLLGALIRSRKPEAAPPRSSVIEAVCAYLQQADVLQLEQTAKHFGYSPEHLSRKFHEETGVSFRTYCERLRMRRAADLLHGGQESLDEIAEQLGYGSTSSFIRAFRRAYGTTPHAYTRRRSPLAERPVMHASSG